MTEHFAPAEFACPECGIQNVSPVLLDALEELRINLGGVPLTILRGGGCRCVEYNRKIGGAPTSEHITTDDQAGEAADVAVPAGVKMASMYFNAAAVKAFYGGGIGIYPGRGFIHVDVRPRRARWGQIRGRREYVAFADAWDELKRRDEGTV